MMEGPIIAQVVVIVTDAGPHVQLKSNNGEIVASTEVYESVQHANDTATRMAEQFACEVRTA